MQLYSMIVAESPMKLWLFSLVTTLAVMLSPSLWAASSTTVTQPHTVKQPHTATQPHTVTQPHVVVSLLSAADSITPGIENFIGFYLKPEPHWHVYWQNPGDSGLAPKLKWRPQPQVSIGDIQWPFPELIPVEHLMNYGYSGDVLLPVPVTISKDYTDDQITFKVSASWLVCKIACVPGKADLSLTLPLAAQGEAVTRTHQALFDQALSKVPGLLSLQGAPVNISDSEVSIQLYAKSALFKQAKQVQFFPITENLVEYATPAKLQWHNNMLRINQSKSMEFIQAPSSIEGIIVIDGKQAWQFKTPGG
jgi:DsbC/DsbD-like thiol-disulfide interchange protein